MRDKVQDKYKQRCLRLGRIPTLVVSSPDTARDVLRTHDHICASRSSTTVTRILLDGCSDMAFAPYDDEWRQRRQICTLHQLSPKMLLGKVARVKKNHKRWDDLLDQVIKEHEERVSSHDEKDFVDVLISLQKDPVLESILTSEVIKALLQHMKRSSKLEVQLIVKMLSPIKHMKKKQPIIGAMSMDNPGALDKCGHNHKTLPSVVGFLLANQNVKDAYQLDWNKSIGEGSSTVPSRRRYVDLKPSSNHTSIELTGTDRPGLLSEASVVLTDLKCNVVSAEVWTHNTRAAAVMQVIDEKNSAITDPQRLSRIKQLFCNVLKGNNRHRGAKTAVSMGITNTERRLHQLMLDDRDYKRSEEDSGNKNCRTKFAL
ncbi:hypothetical protein ZIOFF_009744 [Zingiber officinale]|uniref:ACT domain-containing protein n=1 Tax=Zingiber officinale TaxID=94328 RepID=A0A8J5HHR6_ZINOF|nr:hypothetical protein ZIOFF_009744 [Zingiber officinale]